VLKTSMFRTLRAGLPVLAASTLATAAALTIPALTGEPHSPGWLLLERLGIVAIICCPLLWMVVGPQGRMKQALQ
jgi:hypothetical protein